MTADTDRDPVELLVRRVGVAADGAFLDAQRDGGTGARCVRRALEEALRCAVGNGLVVIVPPDRWPTMTVVSSPYTWEDVL